ncbi:uncharacterized protein FFNC_15233 [Fusarium fujikuroi]|uniref:Uncharacterized protein n=1 Tax=Fusarium fujikuroi TaxID=5127 RepID=A0A9Q9RX00_FUSFU|nr:uncharacterized protein FFNC_15233 [Fusarium fujikuroi]VTT79710.1 unnamed protein product [Fusarium fujikuroi]
MASATLIESFWLIGYVLDIVNQLFSKHMNPTKTVSTPSVQHPATLRSNLTQINTTSPVITRAFLHTAQQHQAPITTQYARFQSTARVHRSLYTATARIRGLLRFCLTCTPSEEDGPTRLTPRQRSDAQNRNATRHDYEAATPATMRSLRECH